MFKFNLKHFGARFVGASAAAYWWSQNHRDPQMARKLTGLGGAVALAMADHFDGPTRDALVAAGAAGVALYETATTNLVRSAPDGYGGTAGVDPGFFGALFMGVKSDVLPASS